MLRLYLDGNGFFSFDQTENKSGHMITSLKLKKEINTLSELTFTVFMSHPLYNSIKIKRSCIALIDKVDNTTFKCLFLGKVRSIKRNLMTWTAEVDCEDLLGCLRDSIVIPGPSSWTLYDPVTFESYYNELDPPTYRKACKAVRDAFFYSSTSIKQCKFGYNANMNLPSVSFNVDDIYDDKIDEMFTESCLFDDYLSLLYDQIIQHTSAVILTSANVRPSPRPDNYNTSTLYVESYNVNYDTAIRDAARDVNTGKIEDKPAMDDPDFKYGENIINISEDEAIDEIVSVIVPYGTLEVKNGANAGTHNIFLKSGYRYDAHGFVANPNEDVTDSLVAKYGYIGVPVNFETFQKYTNTQYQDLSSEIGHAAEDLFYKAEDWARERLRVFSNKYTVNGVDKYFINGTNRFGRPIDIGDILHININGLLGIEEDPEDPGEYDGDIYDFCLSLEIDFFDHENDTYIIGPYITDNMLEYKASEAIKVEKKKNAKRRK